MNFSRCGYYFFSYSLSKNTLMVLFVGRENALGASILERCLAQIARLFFYKLKRKKSLNLQCLQVFVIQRIGLEKKGAQNFVSRSGLNKTHGQQVWMKSLIYCGEWLWKLGSTFQFDFISYSVENCNIFQFHIPFIEL